EKFFIRVALWMLVLIFCCWPRPVSAQAGASNCPPKVSILWPRQGIQWDNSFSVSTLIKIRAEPTDSDGSIAQVQFFVQTNLIGVVTNPPFNVVWIVGEGVPFETLGCWTLKAVAIDDSGTRA